MKIYSRKEKEQFVSKTAERRFNRQMKYRIRALTYLGGKCFACGTTKVSRLTFHHINPLEKEYEISNLYKSSWGRLQSELDKCVLLCRTCHEKEHGKRLSSIIL